MRVALGTIEVSDEARKAIRKLNGGKGDGTRGEVKDYLLSQIDETIIPNIGQEQTPVGATSDNPEGSSSDEQSLEATQEEQAANHFDDAPHGTAPEPVTGEELPEVPGAGPAGGYTGIGTGATGTVGGNLGSDGTAGGTTA